MSFGTKVRRLRFELNLTQDLFGQKIGVDQATVTNYEKNRRMPRMPILQKMIALAKKHKIKINLLEE